MIRGAWCVMCLRHPLPLQHRILFLVAPVLLQHRFHMPRLLLRLRVILTLLLQSA